MFALIGKFTNLSEYKSLKKEDYMLLKVYKSRVWLILFMLLPFVGSAQLPGSPWNFTNHPNSAVYVIPTTVAYNGGLNALSAGDWVGAFYMNDGVLECGGAYQWTGTANITVVAFGNDTLVAPIKNGFYEGETVHWKFYRTATTTEVEVLSTPEYSWTNGALGEVTKFSAATPPVVCQDINLVTGTRLISSYIQPDDLNFKNVMQGVLGNLSIAKNSAGLSLRKIANNWVNGIGNWVVTEGYSVRMNSPALLEICGDQVPYDTPIPVSGTKLVAYLHNSPMNALTAFNNILPNLSIVKNSTGLSLRKIANNWINSIGNLSPGQGYSVRMNAPDILVYPALDNLPSMGKQPETMSRDGHFVWPGGDVMDNTWSLYIDFATLNGVSLQAGDEIAVLDGDKIVGVRILTGVPAPGTYSEELPTFKTLGDGNPGYVPGHPISIKVWSVANQIEASEFEISFIDPGDAWMEPFFPVQNDEYSVVTLLFTTEQAYVPTFNIYQDGSLLTSNVEGNTYLVEGLTNGTEYCYTVTQNLEGGDESCHSNGLCATPIGGCQDVVINNFPTEHADLCAGTELSYDFSGVEVLNAATVTWSVDPVAAGTFTGVIFTLDTDYVGVVTITVFGEATPPCADSTASLSFEVFALPVVTCPEFDAVCSGSDVIDFAAVPGGVYTDIEGVEVTEFDPIEAGTFVFTLTVIDGNNCSAFCDFDIVVLQSAVVYAGADATIEEGETYTIADATVLNTTIILWSTNGDGTFDDVTIANTTYTPGSSDIAAGQVTLTLQGGGVCPDTDSMVLTIGENPCPNPPVANAGPDMEVCQDGEAVQLNGSAEYYSSVTWTTVMASGVFSDEYILNPIYTPGEMDYLLGSVEVILLVNGLPGCDTAVQDTMIITFNELPEVTLAAYAPVCAGIEEFALYGGLPEGGIYYVDGVETLVFDPAVAGEYVVKYTYTDDNGCSNFATGTILVNELPEVTLAAYAPVCEGEEAFDLYGGMPVGGTYFVDGVEALTFNPAVAGLYELMYTYTGENGCSNSAVGTILVNALPIVECPVIEPVCAGSEMIAFEAVEGGVYTNAAGDPVIGFNPIDDGTFVFTLTVTGANGCVGTCDFNIVVNPLPVVECPEFEDVCSGSEMIDFAVVEGGVYTNEAGDIVIGFNPEDVGVYEFTLTVTENGCEGFCTFEITVLQSAVVYAGADAFIEEGETYTISDATASYAIALLWSTDGDGTFDDTTIIDPTYTPGSNDIAAKQVTLSLFGDGDCPDTDTMVLTIGENPCPNPPVVNAGEDMEVCADGEPIELNASSEFCTSYQWFTPDGLGSFSEENILNPTYTPSPLDYAAGSVELCVMAEGLSGCNAVTDCMTITFNPLPEVTLAAYAPVCEGEEEFDLYGGMPVGGTYFVDDVEALTFNPAVAGLYDLMYTYTDDNGCSNSAMGSILVNPLPVVECPVFAPVCEGIEMIVFDEIEGGVYTNEDGAVVAGFNPITAGEYEFTLTVTNEFGCSAFCTFGIEVLPLPTITTQPVDVEVQIGQPFELIVEAVNATGYQWYFNGAIIPDATDAAYTVASALGADAGTYYVIVSGDCGDVTSVEVTVTIAAITPETQVINFYGPVNGMSTYLELINPDMSNIFADVMDDLYYVEMKNPSKIWTPLNTSFDFNESNGAKVALYGGYPSSIEVAGYARTDNTVNLPMGGSYMPIYSRTAVSAADVFGPLGASLYAVYSMDYSGIYWPAFNIYTLQNLIPGSAYNVVMTAPGVANFDVPIVLTAVAGYTNVPANLTSWNDMVLTATQHNIAITAAALSGLQIGDVIGAFNEYGQMAGMVEVTSLIDNLVLRAFGDNPATEAVEGFVEGDMITFKIWRNGVEISAEATFAANLPNQNVFAKDGISAVEGLKAGVTAINDLSTELTANLYPNPATDLVNINTNFVISNIKVINYVGQVIFENNPSQEDFQINTSNLVSGMYFVQIESNEGYVITKRLTIK
ncbi:MAG TPA: T9SS type A sorting domain-containing protein [Bacteroidales bacterium]|nr:T9SS type A sorting domain-containing protein [Bacteroidales bacterium]